MRLGWLPAIPFVPLQCFQCDFDGERQQYGDYYRRLVETDGETFFRVVETFHDLSEPSCLEQHPFRMLEDFQFPFPISLCQVELVRREQ